MKQAKEMLKTTRQLISPFPNPVASLKHKAIRGGFWVTFLRASSWVLWLARIAILARLLSPRDFGLFGIAFTVVATTEALSQTGFQSALIQKNADIEGFLDTAWTVQSIRGIILTCLLIGLAPYMAHFFNEPTVTPLLQVLAFSTMLRGFTSVGILYFQKELEFHKQVVFQLSGVITDLIIAVSTALVFGSIWALVFGLIGSYAAQLAISYILHPYRPHIRFNGQQVTELYHFGRWIFGTSVIYALGTMGINTYIARVMGTTTLGYYQMAHRLAVFPAKEISFIITQVSFPVYVKLQDQWFKMQTGYLKVLRASATVALLLSGLIIFLAADIVCVLLGSEWLSIIKPVQILAFWGLAGIIAAPSTSLFQAMGKPGLSTLLMAIWLAILIFSMYLFDKNRSLTNVSISLTVSSLSLSLMALYLNAKIFQSNIKIIGKYLIIPVMGVTAMGVAISMLKSLPVYKTGLPALILLGILGALIYSGVVGLLGSSKI